jgi:hypothetical protein
MEVLTLGENSENLESRRKKRRLDFTWFLGFFFFLLTWLKSLAWISLKRFQLSTGSSPVFSTCKQCRLQETGTIVFMRFMLKIGAGRLGFIKTGPIM